MPTRDYTEERWRRSPVARQNLRPVALTARAPLRAEEPPCGGPPSAPGWNLRETNSGHIHCI